MMMMIGDLMREETQTQMEGEGVETEGVMIILLWTQMDNPHEINFKTHSGK